MTAKAPIICAQWGAPLFGNAVTVILQQDGIDNFTVTYGKQVRRGLNYARAGAEFGLCVMHAASCDGHLDNRELADARREKDMEINAESIASGPMIYTLAEIRNGTGFPRGVRFAVVTP